MECKILWNVVEWIKIKVKCIQMNWNVLKLKLNESKLKWNVLKSKLNVFKWNEMY